MLACLAKPESLVCNSQRAQPPGSPGPGPDSSPSVTLEDGCTPPRTLPLGFLVRTAWLHQEGMAPPGISLMPAMSPTADLGDSPVTAGAVVWEGLSHSTPRTLQSTGLPEAPCLLVGRTSPSPGRSCRPAFRTSYATLGLDEVRADGPRNGRRVSEEARQVVTRRRQHLKQRAGLGEDSVVFTGSCPSASAVTGTGGQR